MAVCPTVMAHGFCHPSQDDETHHLFSIIQINNQLKKAIVESQTQTVIDDLMNVLQSEITTFLLTTKILSLAALFEAKRTFHLSHLVFLKSKKNASEGTYMGNMSISLSDLSFLSIHQSILTRSEFHLSFRRF